MTRIITNLITSIAHRLMSDDDFGGASPVPIVTDHGAYVGGAFRTWAEHNTHGADNEHEKQLTDGGVVISIICTGFRISESNKCDVDLVIGYAKNTEVTSGKLITTSATDAMLHLASLLHRYQTDNEWTQFEIGEANMLSIDPICYVEIGLTATTILEIEE